jgi:hypothetical protein
MIVTLRWSDNSTNEEGFYIERAFKNKNNPLTYQRIGQTGANIQTFSNTVPSTGTYFYIVQGFNTSTGKVSSYTNTVQINIAGGKGRK